MSTKPHSFFVSGLAFSPDSTHVLSCSGDRTLVVQAVVQQQRPRNILALISLLVLLLAIVYQVFLGQ